MAAAVPPNLKQINSYVKLAKEYDKRDAVIAYYCRMYAVQRGIKIDSKSPESKKFLFAMMDQLEAKKNELSAAGEEAMSNDIVAQAHLDNTTVKLFLWADSEDRKGVFNKSIVKAFYSANLLYDVLSQFEELSEDASKQQKYAKWKATYLHKCIQTGETPIHGPEGSEFENDDLGGDQSTGGQFGNDQASSFSADQSQPGYSGQPGYPGQPGPGYPVQGGGYPQFPTIPPVVPQNYSNQPTPAPRPRPDPTPPPTKAPSESYDVTENAEAEYLDLSEPTKLCKHAISALNYEDIDTAVENLTKALAMLKRVRK